MLTLAALLLAALGLTACDSSSDRQNASVPSGSTTSTHSFDVSFDADSTTTYGTLEVPAHRRGQRLAAALLLAGSGPTDRDGNQSGSSPDTLKLIADVLAQRGIMSLRFDKYFSGRTGAGAANASTITAAAFTRQASDAYALLRGEPDVDTAKMLIVGHSEGGKYALLVAESVSPKPAGLALMEPATERTLSLRQVQIDEQLDRLVANGKITSTVARANDVGVRQAIADFRAGRSVDTSGLLPGLAASLQLALIGVNATYNRSVDPISPPALAAEVLRGTRVLVTDGTSDTKVPPSTVGPLIRALTSAGTTGPGLVLLSGTNHDLRLIDQPDGALAPAVVTALQQWAQPFAA